MEPDLPGLTFYAASSDSNHHRLTEKDTVARTAICSICGPTRILGKASAYGSWKCANNYNKKRSRGRYRKYLSDHCCRCGFQPELDSKSGEPYTCQLDIDHIDGDHQNNDPTNLQTICSGCHRIKSYLAMVGRVAEFSMQRVTTQRRPPCDPHNVRASSKRPASRQCIERKSD